MLFYDLDLNSWVRAPGSSSPSQMTPAITVGSTSLMLVKFCKGEKIVTSFSAVTAGIKISGDFDGSFIAQDNSPTESGGDAFVFQFNLSTSAALAYFTAHPSADVAKAIIQLSYTESGVTSQTTPLAIILQNTYL